MKITILAPSVLAMVAMSSITSFAASSGAPAGPSEALATRQVSTDARAEARPIGALADAPLAGHRAELLELALQAASAMPSFPFVKTRSKVQQDVLSAALELDQPKWVLDHVADIENWRRGLVYADLGHYAAEKHVGEVDVYLASAERVAAEVNQRIDAPDADPNAVRIEMPQSWHRDRIQVRVLQARALMGQPAGATRLADDADPAEVAKLHATRAQLSDPAQFEAEMDYVDRIVAGGVFEQVRAALESCVTLFDREYADSDRRRALATKVRSSWNKLPIDVRIDLLLEMADVALRHADPAYAAGEARAAEMILRGAAWTPGTQQPYLARLARVLHLAGERDRARTLAAEARQQFDQQRDSIVDIGRAGVLRPLAEAYVVMGDREAAAVTYRTVLEEGFVNPNARPRCEDFVATCLSLARQGFEPDAAMWKRLREIRASLKEPW